MGKCSLTIERISVQLSDKVVPYNVPNRIWSSAFGFEQFKAFDFSIVAERSVVASNKKIETLAFEKKLHWNLTQLADLRGARIPFRRRFGRCQAISSLPTHHAWCRCAWIKTIRSIGDEQAGLPSTIVEIDEVVHWSKPKLIGSVLIN